MAEITLAAATLTRPWTAAVKDGSVSAPGFRLEFEEVPVIIWAFRRMVRSLDFDVTEMAFTTYLCAKSFGKPFTALPVFLVRGFHHGAITRSAVAGPDSGAGGTHVLEGQRVGVNRGYTVTTGVWARGILADQYGVDLSRVTWVPSGDEHVAEYRPPANVLSAGRDQDVAAMIASGDLAAGVGFPPGTAGLEPLLPDAEEAGYHALRDRGLYPLNHLLVVQDELLARPARPAAGPGEGDHRGRPAPLRHRAQPGHDRPAGRARGQPAHPGPAVHRRRAVPRKHPRPGGLGGGGCAHRDRQRPQRPGHEGPAHRLALRARARGRRPRHPRHRDRGLPAALRRRRPAGRGRARRPRHRPRRF